MGSMKAVPSFRYPGMKGKLRAWLIDHFPTEGRTYLEPFAGRGNVFFLAATRMEFESWWLNDIRTAGWFEALKICDVMKLPTTIRKAEAPMWKARSAAGDPLARALEVALTYCGIGYDATLTDMAYSREVITEKIMRARSLMRGTLITCKRFPFDTGLGSDDFVYMDPPYLGISVGAYHSSDLDHEAMLKDVARADYRWAVSNYDNELYRRYLGSPTHTIETTRRGLGAAGRNSKVTESLWVKA